ncbi:methylenetetrahydrofolate reductase [NAD(P)H] [Phytohalomonas tamaricis]|uniref:methylenetetrahydrofolate reductase [NAD(P)H] n=1 Tax=Phytohalomonas tamaricis TaxID=2081032 RepID=UPI000D0B71B7|nr:methylenetetrahydrofolate reductase [NAD(P)H] [Phytohalomonas tamaricis]
MGTLQPCDISFEFFPPRTDAGRDKLMQVRDRLAGYDPKFFSVTFGAGGSTRNHTYDTVCDMRQSGINTAPHLSCVSSDKGELRELLLRYRELGIDRLVALRGDMPSGTMAAGELRYASELIEFIREETGDHFNLAVAAYPECHPQAASLERDLEFFAAKVRAGADIAITQYFFDADAYFYFVERVQRLGIAVPVIPGIMPITNYTKLARFSETCGASIPRWVSKQLEAYGDDNDSIRAFGEEVVTRLCQRLVEGGVPGLHFYTLNQAEASLNVLNNLSLR